MSFNTYYEVLVCLVLWLQMILSVGLAQAFMVTRLIPGLWLRIAEAGHQTFFHRNLSGVEAIPLQYMNFLDVAKKINLLYET